MLSPERKNFVTSSDAHKVMGGWERELAGRVMVKPETPYYEAIVSFSKKPLVGQLKDSCPGITGAEIKEVWDYHQATKPVFTGGMRSFAYEKAMDIHLLDTEEESFESAAMRHGKKYEQAALHAVTFATGILPESTGDKQVFVHRDYLGATPDGLSRSQKVGFEVKAPQKENHSKYFVRLNILQENLADVEPKYYAQCQTGMAVTDFEKWVFASYSPRYDTGRCLAWQMVERNQPYIDLLNARAELVIKRVFELREMMAKV